MPDRVQLEDVSFGYRTRALLNNVSVAVPHGGMLVITGRSGNGKSTLLETCAGLVEPLGGRVLWNGRDMWSLSPRRRASMRARVGHMFQRPALISNFTVFENIALPLRYHSDFGEWEIRDRVNGWMEKFGIAHLHGLRPEQLSSDQARWAAFARALVVEPEMLFLDEPTAGADPVTAHTIVRTIGEERRRQGTTVILVTHSVRLVRSMQCPVTVLEDGRLSFLRHLGEGGREQPEIYLREDV
jgi:phospholipid/cholesterol/gamma-HCH transport system ATP-binding protein